MAPTKGRAALSGAGALPPMAAAPRKQINAQKKSAALNFLQGISLHEPSGADAAGWINPSNPGSPHRHHHAHHGHHHAHHHHHHHHTWHNRKQQGSNEQAHMAPLPRLSEVSLEGAAEIEGVDSPAVQARQAADQVCSHTSRIKSCDKPTAQALPIASQVCLFVLLLYSLVLNLQNTPFLSIHISTGCLCVCVSLPIFHQVFFSKVTSIK